MISSSRFGRMLAPAVLAGLVLTAGQPARGNNTVKTIAVLAALGGCSYLCSKGIAKFLLFTANNNYKKHCFVLNTQGYKALKDKILRGHERSFFSAFGTYRNYPLLKYKKNLDWYIRTLWIFRLFNLWSKTGTSINAAMKALNNIRKEIVSDQAFIKERRRFEERQEDKMAAQARQ